MTCFDSQSGKVLIGERLSDGAQGFTASPVSDGQHLHFPGETGEVVVMSVVDKFSTVATNDLGAICMATPAITDGTLCFRTRSKLVAIGNQ